MTQSFVIFFFIGFSNNNRIPFLKVALTIHVLFTWFIYLLCNEDLYPNFILFHNPISIENICNVLLVKNVLK